MIKKTPKKRQIKKVPIRKIIPALDESSAVDRVLEATNDIVEAYAIGSQPVFAYGLLETCETIRRYADNKKIIVKAPIIEHPRIGKSFAKTAKDAGVDAVILLPYTNEFYQKEWTDALKDRGLEVIIGGATSHDDSFCRGVGIYGHAALQGATSFLIPSRSDKLGEYRDFIEAHVKKGITFYAQGIKENQDLVDLKKSIGNHPLHVIVGNKIYLNRKTGKPNSVDVMRKNTLKLIEKLQ